MFIQEDFSTSMLDCLELVDSFYLFENGKSFFIDNKNQNYMKLFNNLKDLFTHSYITPAFGVSLHKQTLNSLNTDSWLQINFSKELTKNNLPFASLLIKLEVTAGTNLIRFYNQEYSGRCIYLNFDNFIDLKNMFLIK